MGKRIVVLDFPAILPKPFGGGNNAIRWGLVQGLINNGFESHLIGLDAKDSDAAEIRERLRAVEGALASKGGTLHWRQRKEGALSGREVHNLFERIDPDWVYAYGASSLEIVPERFLDRTIVSTIDLHHEVARLRLELLMHWGGLGERLRNTWRCSTKFPAESRRLIEEQTSILKRARLVVNHAHMHAKWLESRLGSQVFYFPNPLASEIGARKPRSGELDGKPRFLIVGGLASISTLTGLRFFCMDVLPCLRGELRQGAFEIHVAGRGRIPVGKFRRLLERTPGIELRGFLSDEELTREYAECAAMLVPTPEEIGFRTRVLDAFRHGLPVIAHTANQSGFREMQHGENCLLANTGAEFAEAVRGLTNDPDLRKRISSNSLQCFRESCNADVYIRRLSEIMKQLESGDTT